MGRLQEDSFLLRLIIEMHSLDPIAVIIYCNCHLFDERVIDAKIQFCEHMSVKSCVRFITYFPANTLYSILSNFSVQIQFFKYRTKFKHPKIDSERLKIAHIEKQNEVAQSWIRF